MIIKCECGARHKFLDDDIVGTRCPNCGRVAGYVLFGRGSGKSMRTLKYMYENYYIDEEGKNEVR